MQMTNIYAAFQKPNKNRTYYATYERTSAQKNLCAPAPTRDTSKQEHVRTLYFFGGSTWQGEAGSIPAVSTTELFRVK